MQKRRLFFSVFLAITAISVNAQNTVKDTLFKVVLLGDYQCNQCPFTSSDSGVAIIKACVSDFSSQQLSWTVDELVIKPLQGNPGVCILNTGQLDVVLGVPKKRVIENMENIRLKLQSHNIGFAVMAPLNFSSGSDYNNALTKLSEDIRTYCDSSGTSFIDPNPVLSPEGVLSEDYTKDGFLINRSGCEHWSNIVNDFISGYDKKQ